MRPSTIAVPLIVLVAQSQVLMTSNFPAPHNRTISSDNEPLSNFICIRYIVSQGAIRRSYGAVQADCISLAECFDNLVILRVADSDRLLILLDKVLMVNYFERKYINQILFCTKKDTVFII